MKKEGKRKPKHTKLKILCICAKGANRSKYLAKYLRGKGYSAKFGGIEDDDSGPIINPLSQKDVDWADIIVVVRKRLKKLFKKNFKSKNKKVIALDVTDSKRLIPEQLAHLRELKHEEFQKKWTRPQLRKAIKPYLPFK